MTMRNGVVLFTSVCLMLLCSLSAVGQSQTTGRIAGIVTDEKGAGIPAAEVTVTNKATGEERKVVADDTGHFIAPLLPPGSYTVGATANGFKKFIADDVRVALTETSTLNATLQVGALSESVVINAAPPIVQTEGPQLGRVVDSRAVSELTSLPKRSRRWR